MSSSVFETSLNPESSQCGPLAFMSLKETVRLFSDLVIHCLWKCVWRKECQFVIERCNWSLPQRDQFLSFSVFETSLNPESSQCGPLAFMSLKETVRLFSDLVIHCLWKCVWRKECQFVIERCNWSLPQRWLLKPKAWSPQSCLIDRKADLPSYSNNLPRTHFPGWAPHEPIGASFKGETITWH
jgi:hypothetical protein